MWDEVVDEAGVDVTRMEVREGASLRFQGTYPPPLISPFHFTHKLRKAQQGIFSSSSSSLDASGSMRGLCGFHHATILPCSDGARREENDDEEKRRKGPCLGLDTQSIQPSDRLEPINHKQGRPSPWFSVALKVHFEPSIYFPVSIAPEPEAEAVTRGITSPEAAALSRPAAADISRGLATAAVHVCPALRCSMQRNKHYVPVESSGTGRAVGRAVSWRGNRRFCSDLHFCCHSLPHTSHSRAPREGRAGNRA